MNDLHDKLRYLTPVGRLLLVILFIYSGIGKITGYEATQANMESMGIPGMLLPLTIALEVVGALAVLVGWKARWIALLIAGFSIITAFLFHPFSDPEQQNNFLKNIAIAGGFLMIAGHGPGALSLDKKPYNYSHNRPHNDVDGYDGRTKKL